MSGEQGDITHDSSGKYPEQTVEPNNVGSGNNKQNSAHPAASHRQSRYASYTVEELKRRKWQFTSIQIVLFIIAMILAWASFGLMMRTGFLPAFDLGYSWFDEHIVNFFGITAGRTSA